MTKLTAEEAMKHVLELQAKGDMKGAFVLCWRQLNRKSRLLLLALHVADYQQRFGVIPPGGLLDLLGVVEITEEQAKLLRNGMEILVGYLGHMREGGEDEGAMH